MTKNGFLKRHGIVRNSIKKDILQFAIPGLALFILELSFCVSDGMSGFWRSVWGLIRHPQTLSELPTHSMTGLALFFIGLTIMCVSQITLYKNYSGTVVIRENHQLVTHGIYHFTRNPMYLGLIMVVTGLPVWGASLSGFITSLFLIPIILNRVRLEDELLTETFKDAYQEYKKTTKKLIPFIY